MLKKFTLSTFFFLLIFNLCYAQPDTLRWRPGLKLKPSDFLIDLATTHVFADIVVRYQYASHPLKAGKYVPIVHAFAMLNRSNATLPGSDGRALRYAQLLFDLSGYEARLIEWRAFELGELTEKVDPIKPTMDRIFLDASNEVSRLRKGLIEQLSRRNDAQTLEEWETKVTELLRTTPEIIEQKVVGNIQIGLFAGIAQSIFTGKTKDHFTNATGLDLGFDLDIKRSRVALDMGFGFNKTKKELEGKGDWPAALKTNLSSIEITYGMKFRKNKWLAVPFAGLGINEFTPAKSDNDDRRHVVGYSPVVGFELDRLLKNMTDPRENASLFYCIRASVNPSNFIRNYGGTQLNIKVAIGLNAAKTKRKLVRKM